MSTEAAGGDEIRRFEEQYRRNPDSLVFARLADAHRKAGDPDRALQVLDEGIRRHRDYPSAHIIRARTFIDLGRAEEADGAFRHVLDLDAQNLVAMRGLAELTEDRGDLAAAAEWHERIAALDPLNEEASEALLRLRAAAVPDAIPDAVPDPVPDPAGEDLRGPGPAGVEPLEPTSEEWWTTSSPVVPSPVPAPSGNPGPRPYDEGPGEVETIGDHLSSPRRVPEAAEAAEGLDATDAGTGSDRDAEPETAGGSDAPPESAAGSESGTAWWFEDPSEADSADDGDLLTRTMADLYARQGLVDEAAAIYRELLVDRPGDPELERALASLQEGLGEEPEVEPEPVTPARPPRTRPPRADDEVGAAPVPSEGVAAAEGSVGRDDAPAPVAVDPYASHDIPATAARSAVFLDWLRRLE